MSIAETILFFLQKNEGKTREEIIEKLRSKDQKNSDVWAVWDTLIRFQKQKLAVENMDNVPFTYFLTELGLKKQKKLMDNIKARP